jgi:hypothetical protein
MERVQVLLLCLDLLRNSHHERRRLLLACLTQRHSAWLHTLPPHSLQHALLFGHRRLQHQVCLTRLLSAYLKALALHPQGPRGRRLRLSQACWT